MHEVGRVDANWEGIAFVDGQIGLLGEARIPVTDRGFLYGDGIFCSVRIESGKPRFWSLHLQRLARDAAALGLILPDPKILTEAVFAVARVLPPLGQARVSLTRKSPTSALGSVGQEEARLVILGRPLQAASPTLEAISWRAQRNSLLAPHKVVNYLDNILALQSAQRAGVDEMLWVDAVEGALEFATGALFVRTKGGEAIMPKASAPILDSVGRRAIVVALGASAPRQCMIDSAELAWATEIVHCNAVHGPRAVVALDGRVLQPGPLLEDLCAAFAASEAV